MDQRICVFDLDGTLADHGKPVAETDRQLLLRLSEHGHRIVLCSGKPTYYLCGLARQLGIRDIILIGENGASMQFGVDLPPKQYVLLPAEETVQNHLLLLKKQIDQALDHPIWYQPNDRCLTPFPQSEEDFEIIAGILAAHPELTEGTHVYRHVDSFDIAPLTVSKAHALQRLSEMLNVPASGFVAVGDGTNDYPMFDFAGTSLGIRLPDPNRVTKNFDTVTEALTYLLFVLSISSDQRRRP